MLGWGQLKPFAPTMDGPLVLYYKIGFREVLFVIRITLIIVNLHIIKTVLVMLRHPNGLLINIWHCKDLAWLY